MMIHGTITKTLDDGTEAEAHYMIDVEKGELIQVGGEAHIVAEDIDIIMAMLENTPPEQLRAMVAEQGDSGAKDEDE